MRRLTAIVLALVLSFSSIAAQDTKTKGQSPKTKDRFSLVFTHVNVIDVRGGPVQPDMTVVISGNSITALGKTKSVRLPKGAQVVDATGKFLIPGLWDMHVHALYPGRPEFFFPLMIANGVTGVREMASAFSFAEINRIRNEIKTGKTLGPRFGAVPGKILEGPGIPGFSSPEFVIVSSAQQARETVRSYKQQGADFIKVYNLLPRDVYIAIADEAKRQRIPFAGHVPNALSAAEASDLGQRSMEHAIGLSFACSRNEAELRKEFDELIASKNPATAARVQLEIKALDSYDEQKATALFARFVRNDTWQCPTATVGAAAVQPEDALTNDPRLKYIPRAVRERWRDLFKQRFGVSPGALAQLQTRFQRRLEIVGAMQRAGVGILAGTDAGFGNPYTYPGFSLHEELSLLVNAGLTPIQALQAATINAARHLKLEKTLGTVERGKLADLVLLNANPLDDITNTGRIAAVVVNGHYLSEAELKKMLADVEAAAALPPPVR
ncbi:MAG TPA: amidohydrolase family protein [Pyrinomonadaceae bacterium]|nr:amidohydrolase family protein [Pyrinomonadaceae bacterium]